LAEFTKYDSFIVDLNTIETQVSVLVSNYRELSERNRELDGAVKELRSENTLLLQKISKLEKDLRNFESGNPELFNSLDTNERNELKAKLQSFLDKIEYHLSS